LRADSLFPDPYDALVLGHDEQFASAFLLRVCPYYFGKGKLIGAVDVKQYPCRVFLMNIDARALEIIGTMAAMTLNTAILMEQIRE